MSSYWIPESVIGAIPIPLCSVLIVILTGVRSTWCHRVCRRMTKHPHQMVEHVHNTQKALGWITKAKWEGSPNADVKVVATLEKWDWEVNGVMHWVRYRIATNDADADDSMLRLEPGWNSPHPFPHVITKRHTFTIAPNSPDWMSPCNLYEILLTGVLGIVIR